MVADGIADHADPSSILRAAEMMLRHMGMTDKADKLSQAVDYARSNTKMSGDGKGDTADTFEKYVTEKL